MVRYLDPFYGTDITESVLYKLASLHRSEIIKDFEDGSVFRITYSYVTRRGQTRVHEKFIFFVPVVAWRGWAEKCKRNLSSVDFLI